MSTEAKPKLDGGLPIAEWRASWRRFKRKHRWARWIIPALLVFLAFSYPWWGLEGPLSSIFNDGLGIDSDTLFNVSVYVMLALGLNVVVGYAGLLDLGYVAFFALGAYTLGWFGSGLFSDRDIHFLDTNAARLPGIHLSFWVVVILAGVICAIAGTIIGWPTLRLRGDYLAIVTLGFGEIIPDVFRNGDDIRGFNLTNGVRGVTQMDRPGFGEKLHNATGGILPDRYTSLELRPWYWTILVMMLITIFVNLRLRDSKMGRAWIAVREDEVAASAMGVPLMRTKLWAYAIGAIFGGFAGAVYGSFINGIFPTSFSFQISVIVLVMVIVGGMGNIWGVIAGAVLIAWLNFTGLTKIGDWINSAIPGTSNDFDIAKYKIGIFGALLVLMMLFRPEGLIPSARRKAEFTEADQESLYDVEMDEARA
ncbi:MAG TPA: branched-chain amino acid ABC transporter permease [Gaiellaceae bacterium]|nr:branched-chain amino acid ABC transporter permease [Gaiellaceae bacterium]